VQYGFFESIWALYVADRGANALAIGLSFSTFAIAFMAMAPIGGRIADRGGQWRWLLAGHLGLAAVITGYGLVPWVPAILALGLCEGAVAAVAAVAFPTLDAFVAGAADPRVQGRVQGAFSSAMMAGAAASALGGSALYAVAPGLPFVAGGAAVALLTLVAIGLIRGAGEPIRLGTIRSAPANSVAAA
jgi:MFS family permease